MVIACGVAAPAMLGVAAVTVAAGVLTSANGVSDIGESVTGKMSLGTLSFEEIRKRMEHILK